MIIYSAHLEAQLKRRKIHKDYPAIIYEEPDTRYFDSETGSYIATKRLMYEGKLRDIMIAYRFEEENVRILTSHLESETEIANRIRKGRYIHYEKIQPN